MLDVLLVAVQQHAPVFQNRPGVSRGGPALPSLVQPIPELRHSPVIHTVESMMRSPNQSLDSVILCKPPHLQVRYNAALSMLQQYFAGCP